MSQSSRFTFLKIVIVLALLLNMGKVVGAQEQIFDPLDVIINSQYGSELVNLYHSAEKEPDKTLTALDTLKSKGVFNDNEYYKAIYYRIIHNIQLIQSDVKGADKTAAAMYLFGVDKSEPWIIAEALTLKGILATKKGKGEQAFRIIEQAIELCEELNYDRLLSRALNTRGVLHSRNLHYELALKDYQRAIPLAASINNYSFLSKLYSNISVVYSRVKDWPSAIKYNKKATEIYIKSPNISFEHLVVLYSNASHQMLQVNNITAATEFSQKSTEVARKSNNIMLVVNALWTEAELYIKQGFFDQAKSMCLECLELTENMYDPLPQNQCLFGMGEVSLSEGNTILASDYAHEAMDGFESINNQDWFLKSHELLGRIYQQQKQYPKAIDHLKAHYEGRQKLLFNQREQQLFELKAKYEEQIQSEKISSLTIENELKAEKIDKKELQEKLWMFILGIFTIGFVIMLHRYLSSEKRVSHLRSSNKNLFIQSNKDELTGLYNRRFIGSFVARGVIKSDVNYYSVLMLDCDLFKNVNDTYGHEIGDEVLKICAARLLRCTREHDLLARWGGEEFLILLALETDELKQQILDRFNQVIASEPIIIDGVELTITISIGATTPVAADQLAKGWQHYKTLADVALYQAKDRGRDCAVIAENKETE